MKRSLKELEGFSLKETDGELGKVPRMAGAPFP